MVNAHSIYHYFDMNVMSMALAAALVDEDFLDLIEAAFLAGQIDCEQMGIAVELLEATVGQYEIN